MSTVRCYAGDSYPERPTALRHAGAWRQVTEVLGQARTPDGMIFRVQADDGRRYQLFWDIEEDIWRVTPMSHTFHS